ncbi:MAG: putative nucleotidyltransferase component of viral defense system [Sulfurimonas sp.]|jgi:predicted nucleotidyltransferase component of viral defense system|uniref:nucleotidyl transferase AbiEii/AbiGii toxin family protein n=1 Tax=Sulfurimonas sp. TaxID=2022749 RepID=UPI0039E47865
MINHVKVTFFDGSDNRGVRDIFDKDEYTKIGDIEICSVDSIFAMKSLMFYNRAKSRDYYDLFYLYKYNSTKYSIEKTVTLIQKYEFSYQDKRGYELFIEKIKNANYSKMYDEPLMGLVEEPEEFPILQKRMIELLNSLVV